MNSSECMCITQRPLGPEAHIGRQIRHVDGDTEEAIIAPGEGVVSMCGRMSQVSLLHLLEWPLVMPWDGPDHHHHIIPYASLLTICVLARKWTLLQEKLYPYPDPHQVKSKIIFFLQYSHFKRRINLWLYAGFTFFTGTLIPSPLNWETFF